MDATLAERLLRLIFQDQRTGWGRTSYERLNEDGSQPVRPRIARSIVHTIGMLMFMKLFPFLWRRKLNKEPKGIRKIDYWGLKGDAPRLPEILDDRQRAVLTAFAVKPELWQIRTNLWRHFGLPDRAEDLLPFIADHT